MSRRTVRAGAARSEGTWVRWSAVLALAGLLPLFAACGSVPTAPDDVSDAEITLSRLPCFGECPVYTVTLHGDGRVVYDGEHWVGVEGRQEAHVDPAEVESLVGEFFEADFFSLQDEYTREVTDHSTVSTSVTVGDQSKTVSNYANTAPRKLADLEDRIDEVAGAAQWVARK